jgi:hypothetical protein
VFHHPKFRLIFIPLFAKLMPDFSHGKSLISSRNLNGNTPIGSQTGTGREAAGRAK